MTVTLSDDYVNYNTDDEPENIFPDSEFDDGTLHPEWDAEYDEEEEVEEEVVEEEAIDENRIVDEADDYYDEGDEYEDDEFYDGYTDDDIHDRYGTRQL